MSVGNQQIQYEYIADGNTVIFPFSCRVIYATDISVTIDGNIIKPDTYKVDGVDQPNGGNVVFYNAPAAGCYVVISRDIDLVRNTDYQTNGDFLAKTVNRDFDRIWMALQKFGNLQTEIDTVSNNMIQGWVTVESFEKGATLNLKNQVLLWEKDGQYYHWAGKLPKVIAKNSTPQTAGGIGGGRWVLIGDASLRASLASKAGASMVRTTTGESLQQILDAWPKNNNNLFLILVKMAEGGVVKIACYGDSTTDGVGTTKHKKNVTGTNHNLNAPNAWPAQLQILLREMYQNNAIYVFNAGFSGKRIENGWATNNYEANITKNPHYGVCDMVIINFGLNDAFRTDRLNRYISQTEILIKKIINDGSTPVLLSCNLTYLSKKDGGERDKQDVTQRYDQAKKYLAQKYNIPFFDLSNAMLSWLQRNDDQYKWGILQPDGLHFGDAGHKYQAMWLASRLYSNTVIINDATQYQSINFMDSKANSPFGFASQYTGTGTKYLSLVLEKDSQRLINTSTMDIYAWCETNNVACVYRQFSHENATGSHVIHTDIMSNAVNTYRILPRFDMTNGLTSYGGADVPRYVCNLKFGLNKLSYKFDRDKQINKKDMFFGHFDFVKNYEANLNPRNLIYKSGPIRSLTTIPAGKSLVNHIKTDLYDFIGQDSLQLFVDGKKTYLYLEFDGPELNGIVLTHARGMRTAYNDGFMLFKTNNANLSVHVIRTNIDTNETTYSTAAKGVIPIFIDKTTCKVLLEFYIDKSNNMVMNSVNEQYKLLSNHTISPDYAFPFSGVFGNIFNRNASKTKNISAQFNITRAEVWYSDITD
ncbi:MAG: hypothetical protein [Bacteriophage sp.]|nr:MAG: hypothetical protein [Bacteriophage sp.]